HDLLRTRHIHHVRRLSDSSSHDRTIVRYRNAFLLCHLAAVSAHPRLRLAYSASPWGAVLIILRSSAILPSRSATWRRAAATSTSAWLNCSLIPWYTGFAARPLAAIAAWSPCLTACSSTCWRFLRSSSVRRAAMTSGCLSVKRSSSSSSRAWVSRIALAVSAPPAPAPAAVRIPADEPIEGSSLDSCR